MIRFASLFLFAAISWTACNSSENQTITTDTTALNSITEEGFLNAVKTLSSDEFMGRMPFTEGETKTINYLKEQFESIGLEPGNGDSFFQEVPLVEITSTPAQEIIFEGKNGKMTLNLLEDFVMGSRHVTDNISVKDSEMIFAGFGIVAPEYNWNDYEGLDVKGKT